SLDRRVDRRIAGHQDGLGLWIGATEVPEQVGPAAVGQVLVDQGDVDRRLALDGRDGRGAGGDEAEPARRALEDQAQHPVNGLLVIDNQDVHGPLYRNRRAAPGVVTWRTTTGAGETSGHGGTFRVGPTSR